MSTSHAIVLANRLALESGNRLSVSAIHRIRKTLEGLAAVGVREAVVVDGRHAEALQEGLALHELPSLRVAVLANLSWKNLSGAAVRMGRKWIEDSDRCLVVRGDRPLDVETLGMLVRVGLESDDRQTIDAAVVVSTGDLDPRHEVRVAFGADRGDGELRTVAAIGEDLDTYDGIYTGHALVNGALLEALDALPNPTVEHGLLALATRGRVVALPCESWQWARRPAIPVEDKVEALLETKRHDRYMLLNPGPVNTTATVKSALVHHDVCHRDAIFSELMVSLTGKLRRIFKGTPHHTVVAITGSGTAAMESALASTVPPDRKILIVDNGAFGARLVEVATVHEMNIVHLRYAWGQQIDPADVARALEQHPDIAVVAMIHHETSVGLLNPVGAVGALCRAHDALLVVDAVSSLGAEDLDVVRDNIDICYSSANKCLHAVSGAAFLCVSPRVWPRIEKLKPRAYYLDLRRYRKYMDELAQTPFTPAVSTYFALDAACTEYLADGHRLRTETYARRNRRIREGLAALGMPAFTDTGNESHSIVTARMPEGVAFDDLYEAVKLRGIIIYGCKGVLTDRFLQIANMGELDDADIDLFLQVLAEEIARLRAGATAGTMAIAAASSTSLPAAHA
ncbi:MAG TPA: alanine--glyoxylate aminotransferase family protein [Kofleriaceae bacterium]|nr:alanine--glyoxylate aminotransferase family protein [Kofleriaceae bacterium]